MPPAPDELNQNLEMPLDFFALTEWLDKTYPNELPSGSQLGTEAGRMKIAERMGQRELIDNLKSHAARKGG